MLKNFVNSEQAHVIKAVTFGNILEWFDVYSFAYLAPILSRKFFPNSSSTEGLILAFLVFGVGFLTRPIGGVLFGRIGDIIGRKYAFILSILLLIFPTFCMGILPTYATWGIYAPITLFILRLMQAIPTGGEIPGTICFLYENAEERNRRFVTSWNAVGNQIGAIVAILEAFLMENYFSTTFNEEWGWRISFISGTLIGLVGLYLRHALHETPVFERLKKTHRIDNETLLQLLRRHRKQISIGTAFGVVDAATFYLVATYVPTYIGEMLQLSINTNLLISMIILVVITMLLPIFGYLGDRFSNRKICIFSSIFVILLLYPLSQALAYKNLFWLGVIGALFLIPITSITALIAYIVGALFPAQVRFTGVGIAINLADGLIGGFTPAISLLLFQLTGNEAAFCWYVFACASISLVSYITALRD